MVEVTALDVALHGTSIGTLTSLPGERTFFTFDPDYIDDLSRDTLSLSFKDLYGELFTETRPTSVRVPPFFSNLLPEGALRDYLARRAGVHPNREFQLLRALGRDLPGAITVTSSEDSAEPRNARDASGKPIDEGSGALRFSLADVQLKLSAVMEARGGLTVPAEGSGGSWIVKLPSASFDRVPENEFAMMRLASEIGLPVPETRLVPLRDITGLPENMARVGGSAFAICRFDRDAHGATVHTEDFAQVFGLYPERKYERASYRNIAEVLLAESGNDAVADFVRRLVFNTLIGNADMHLKNWSLIYPDRRVPELAPCYDLVSTIAYVDDTDIALSLGRSKRMTELSCDQLEHFAATAGLSRTLVRGAARATVERFMEHWCGGRAVSDVAEHTVEPISRLLGTIPLVREVRQ